MDDDHELPPTASSEDSAATACGASSSDASVPEVPQGARRTIRLTQRRPRSPTAQSDDRDVVVPCSMVPFVVRVHRCSKLALQMIPCCSSAFVLQHATTRREARESASDEADFDRLESLLSLAGLDATVALGWRSGDDRQRAWRYALQLHRAHMMSHAAVQRPIRVALMEFADGCVGLSGDLHDWKAEWDVRESMALLLPSGEPSPWLTGAGDTRSGRLIDSRALLERIPREAPERHGSEGYDALAKNATWLNLVRLKSLSHCDDSEAPLKLLRCRLRDNQMNYKRARPAAPAQDSVRRSIAVLDAAIEFVVGPKKPADGTCHVFACCFSEILRRRPLSTSTQGTDVLDWCRTTLLSTAPSTTGTACDIASGVEELERMLVSATELLTAARVLTMISIARAHQKASRIEQMPLNMKRIRWYCSTPRPADIMAAWGALQSNVVSDSAQLWSFERCETLERQAIDSVLSLQPLADAMADSDADVPSTSDLNRQIASMVSPFPQSPLHCHGDERSGGVQVARGFLQKHHRTMETSELRLLLPAT